MRIFASIHCSFIDVCPHLLHTVCTQYTHRWSQTLMSVFFLKTTPLNIWHTKQVKLPFSQPISVHSGKAVKQGVSYLKMQLISLCTNHKFRFSCDLALSVLVSSQNTIKSLITTCWMLNSQISCLIGRDFLQRQLRCSEQQGIDHLTVGDNKVARCVFWIVPLGLNQLSWIS